MVNDRDPHAAVTLLCAITLATMLAAAAPALALADIIGTATVIDGDTFHRLLTLRW